RNYLTATVGNIEHKGSLYKSDRYYQWGIRYQHEAIKDNINEWIRNDSAGYSIPYYNSTVDLVTVVKSEINLSSSKFNGYFQETFEPDKNFSLTGGLRFHYWDLNNELLFSPRWQFAYKPNWKRDFVFKAASGIYYQPPFYREMRDLQGNINKNIQSQKSIHFVVGGDWHFPMWNRPFKFITEIYYKQLNNLIPYEIDNVHIRYYADNIADGYATGIDFRIHGEFVEDAESWASLSIMKTAEDIRNDFYYKYYDKDGDRIEPLYVGWDAVVDSQRVEPGYIPRPTDQRVNFGMFFQDYVPGNKNYKMNLNFLFGSGLPFGPPDYARYKDTLRIPSYRRVDIGFSMLLAKNSRDKRVKKFTNNFKSIWLTAEIFNLLQINNTVSYLWVKDINNIRYAIPNYLTSRRLNLRLLVKI
ncbi:MAG: TonB-dependent receptor, partial [Bacteroidetes bacterium]|nr:TonB-dependent receptor [Bacteroidota bacterium]